MEKSDSEKVLNEVRGKLKHVEKKSDVSIDELLNEFDGFMSKHD